MPRRVAAQEPPPSLTTKSQFLRPRVTVRCWRSARLLSSGNVAVVDEAGEGLPVVAKVARCHGERRFGHGAGEECVAAAANLVEDRGSLGLAEAGAFANGVAGAGFSEGAGDIVDAVQDPYLDGA